MTTPQQARKTSGQAREDQAKIAARIVAAAYYAADARIFKLLASLAVKVIKGVIRETIARRLLEQQVRRILADAEAQAVRALGAADRAARADADRITADARGGHERPAAAQAGSGGNGGAPPLPPGPTPTPNPDGEAAARAVQEALGLAEPPTADSIAVRLHQAGLVALRSVDDVFRDVIAEAMAYHTAIGSKVRDLRGAQRAAESLSRLQVAQKALDLFAERGITAFTDAAGRNWDLASYVEMATRTAASRMHLMLQLQAMGPAGMDLVVVDGPSAAMSCPKCAPWEGQVLSLGATGAGTPVSARTAAGLQMDATVNGTVAEAVAAGLLHQNCRHSLVPFTDGAAFLPLAGTQRPFVTGGQPTYRGVLPDKESPAYKAEQRQRGLERLVRKWDARLQVAITPHAKARAQAGHAEAVSALREHADAYHSGRRPGREWAASAR